MNLSVEFVCLPLSLSVFSYVTFIFGATSGFLLVYRFGFEVMCLDDFAVLFNN